MVLSTFSPARGWRLAVGPASTRTLGLRTTLVQHSSRKCACRREWNSHDAAKPRMPVQHGPLAQIGRSDNETSSPMSVTAGRKRRPAEIHEHAGTASKLIAPRGFGPACQRACSPKRSSQESERPERSQGVEAKCPMRCFALQGAERRAKSWAGAADARVPRLLFPCRYRESRVARLQ